MNPNHTGPSGPRTHNRHAEIIDHLLEAGEASVLDLAQRFHVSLMTIRRDLAQLETAGKLTRTHGGAVLSKAGIVEFAFQEQGRQRAAEKCAIAKEAAGWIEPGMSVSLDSGTTTLEVAKALSTIQPLTVLTSSLAIASVLYACEGIELVLLGGTVRHGSPDLTGWLTEENLREFHVDLAIVGADGVTSKGAFTRHVDQTRVCQAMLAGAKRSLLTADSSKFGNPAFTRFAKLTDFDGIITDSGLPAKEKRWLTKAANDVIVTKVS
ncbi:MAG: DeoR/GlpR transcriptional regulator [Candidatus Omnitrophica bacterium]|nr:DeoR/GlpR transcriptional regulator [Candidatus Omnitrophota bacterium]